MAHIFVTRWLKRVALNVARKVAQRWLAKVAQRWLKGGSKVAQVFFREIKPLNYPTDIGRNIRWSG